jgi:peptidoglycan/LPS O-acetylase OafA/YrhL
MTKDRIYYLDWFRVFAILTVFLIHNLRFFDVLPWHVKNQEQSLVATHIMVFLSGWIMPLFLVISGAGTYFSLRSRSAGRFIKDRTLRLMVPYLAGLVILLPPQKYYEALYYSSFEGPYLDFLTGYIPVLFDADIGISPTWLGHIGYHLWFLAFLWLFSVISLPFFQGFRSPRLRGRISELASIAAYPFGIFLLALPIIAVNLALKAATPAYLSWADFLAFLLFFVLGYLVFLEPRFTLALERNRWPALVMGLGASLFIHITFQTGQLGGWMDHPAYSPGFLTFQVVASLNAFAWTVFLMGVGRRTFRSSHKHLGYLNELVLPFYAVHQTVILVLGFYIVQLGSSIAVKYVLVTALSFLVIAALLELLIRRAPPLRWLFGMRPSS